jgi:hypothetical protein
LNGVQRFAEQLFFIECRNDNRNLHARFSVIQTKNFAQFSVVRRLSNGGRTKMR